MAGTIAVTESYGSVTRKGRDFSVHRRCERWTFMKKVSYSRVNLDKALASVSPAVKQAFEMSSGRLTNMDIPHVLIGGLAVNAHGYHYATADVDYLVAAGDAFEGSFILTHKAGIPFEVAGVQVDYVTIRPDYPPMVQDAMQAALTAAKKQSTRIVIVQDWLLVWMKLEVGRTKDLAAVEGLLSVGLDAAYVREKLMEAGSSIRVLGLFDRCVAKAQ
jgi:hypothetical protein